MRYALSRTTIIVFSSLMWIFFAVFALKRLSPESPVSPPSPIGSQIRTIFYATPEMTSITEMPIPIALPDVTFAQAVRVDVRLTKDDEWVVSRAPYVFINNEMLAIRNLDSSQLNTLGLMKVYDYAMKLQQNVLWLRISEGELGSLTKLVQQLKSIPKKMIFGAESQAAAIVNDLKKIEPDWLYGSTSVELSRLQFLSALGLGSLANIEADYVIVDRISKEVLDELNKRNKFVVYFNRKSSDFSVTRNEYPFLREMIASH